MTEKGEYRLIRISAESITRPAIVNEAGAARIVAIEADRADSAGRVIDAHGSVVAPGFIDIQTHSDFTLPSSRGAPKVCSYDPWQRRT